MQIQQAQNQRANGLSESGIPVFQLQTERSGTLTGLNNTDLGNLEGRGAWGKGKSIMFICSSSVVSFSIAVH